jgi:hypothetical protein
MMKSASAPRQIYTRNNVVHVCFEGRTFAPVKATELNQALPVTIAKLKSDGGRARVEVTQAAKGVQTKVEVWRTVNVPRKPRA